MKPENRSTAERVVRSGRTKTTCAQKSPVVTVNMEGALYFAAVEDLDHELLRAITPETRVIVVTGDNVS